MRLVAVDVKCHISASCAKKSIKVRFNQTYTLYNIFVYKNNISFLTFQKCKDMKKCCFYFKCHMHIVLNHDGLVHKND